MTTAIPPPPRDEPAVPRRPSAPTVRRRVYQIPSGIRILVLGCPFVLAAWLLPWYGFLIYSGLAGLLFLVTSKACPTCGRRNFQGMGRVFLGSRARCSHCGELFSR